MEDASALVLQETLTRFGMNCHHQRDLEANRSEGLPAVEQRLVASASFRKPLEAPGGGKLAIVILRTYNIQNSPCWFRSARLMKVNIFLYFSPQVCMGGLCESQYFGIRRPA